MNAVFTSRRDAGQKLAQQLTACTKYPDAVVLALPRGGVPVAYEIATNLDLPLDVCLVKKLSLPKAPETAIGAVVEDALIHDYSGKLTIIDQDYDPNNSSEIEAIAAQARAELRWQDRCYRNYRPILQVKGKVVIIVDDGLATGLTMQAAIKALRQLQPQKIVVAIPIASSKAIARLRSLVDKIICLFIPNSLGAVGFWYEDFTQISDREVCDLLSQKPVGKVVSS
ncbi:MAG: phosphoribosyltransferase family protein [Cyanobacteria bacterium P01_A01_bin.83]